MVFKCPKGTKKQFRFKKTKKGKVRLGGCAKKGRFTKKNGVKEIKKFPSGKPFTKRLQKKLKAEIKKVRKKRS